VTVADALNSSIKV